MTTFAELKAWHIAHLEEELAFKEAALRYCRHSKKKAKLVREVREQKEIIAWLKGEIDFSDMNGAFAQDVLKSQESRKP